MKEGEEDTVDVGLLEAVGVTDEEGLADMVGDFVVDALEEIVSVPLTVFERDPKVLLLSDVDHDGVLDAVGESELVVDGLSDTLGELVVVGLIVSVEV